MFFAKHEKGKCCNCSGIFTRQELSSIEELEPKHHDKKDFPVMGSCPMCKSAVIRAMATDLVSWDLVLAYYSLDKGYAYTEEQIQLYSEAFLSEEARKESIRVFVETIAGLKKPGEMNELGKLFEPQDLGEDSHECLMKIIDTARSLCAEAVLTQ